MVQAPQNLNTSKGTAGKARGTIPVSYKPMTPNELALWARDAARKENDVSTDGHLWLGVSTSTQQLLLLEPLYQHCSNLGVAINLERTINPFQRRVPYKDELNQVYLAKQAINTAIKKSGLPTDIVQPLNDERHWSGSIDHEYPLWLACAQNFSDGKKCVVYNYTHQQIRLVLSLSRKAR